MPVTTIRDNRDLQPEQMPNEVDHVIADARGHLHEEANFILLIVGAHRHGDLLPGSIGAGEHHEQEVYAVGPGCAIATSLIKAMEANDMLESIILSAVEVYTKHKNGGKA